MIQVIPWTRRSKAESVSMPGLRVTPYWGGSEYNVPMERADPVGRAVSVPGGWLGVGCFLPWSRQTELIDRRRKVVRVVLPGDWP